MSASPKSGYFILEGLNSFAAAYFFNHFLFHLRDHHGFTQLHSLALLAGFGAVYAVFSVIAGRFAQRHGYFTSLTIGFGGLFASVALAWVWPALSGQIIALLFWSVAICFTWPVLEALCSEFEPPGRLPARVGLYNVVWSLLQAMGVAAGGIVMERFGWASLFVVPLAIHGGQLLMLPNWHRKRRQYVAAHYPDLSQPAAPRAAGPAHFQTMAWIANPLSYMAANALTASLPALAQRLQLSQAEAGVWLGVWTWVRTAGFVGLWWWSGWHYRFGLFFASFGATAVGFLAVMLAPGLAWIAVAQVAFGLGVALTYYSSLFYAMDGSTTHGEQGGTHEALIGLGLGGGPGLAALAILSTGSPISGAVAVTTLLGAGMGAVGWLHGRARKKVGR